jgi:hypothetical protein
LRECSPQLQSVPRQKFALKLQWNEDFSSKNSWQSSKHLFSGKQLFRDGVRDEKTRVEFQHFRLISAFIAWRFVNCFSGIFLLSSKIRTVIMTNHTQESKFSMSTDDLPLSVS